MSAGEGRHGRRRADFLTWLIFLMPLGAHQTGTEVAGRMDLPLSLWPRSKTLTGCFFFFKAMRSRRSCSSMVSLTLRASASSCSRVAFSSGVSFGGGERMEANGSSELWYGMREKNKGSKGGNGLMRRVVNDDNIENTAKYVYA